MKSLWRRILWILAGLIGLYWIGSETERPEPGPPARPSVFREGPSRSPRDLKRLPAKRPEIKPSEPLARAEPEFRTPASVDDDADLTLVSAQTLNRIDEILERLRRELEAEAYGPPGSLSFNIVFQFRQSLVSFRRFLEDPFEGPDFRFSLKREILGRYHTGEEKILLGPDTGGSEGVFLAVLFHEYQHHLHNTFFGPQVAGDLAGQFHNEVSAHLFENLFSTYLPESYFDRPFRGRFPLRLRQALTEGKGEEVLSLSLKYLLLLRNENGEPFYTFLRPVYEGEVSVEELVGAIDEDFMPEEIE